MRTRCVCVGALRVCVHGACEWAQVGIVYDCSAAEQSFFTPDMAPEIHSKSVQASARADFFF